MADHDMIEGGGEFDELGGPDLDSVMERTPKRHLQDMLEGKQIARVRRLSDVGAFGCPQFGFILTTSEKPLFMAFAVPETIVGLEFAYGLFATHFERIKILTRAMIAEMTQDRHTLGEPEADEVCRRIEGELILQVPPDEVNEHGGTRMTLELAGGATVYLDAVSQSVGYPGRGYPANYRIVVKAGPKREYFVMGSGRKR